MSHPKKVLQTKLATYSSYEAILISAWIKDVSLRKALQEHDFEAARYAIMKLRELYTIAGFCTPYDSSTDKERKAIDRFLNATESL